MSPYLVASITAERSGSGGSPQSLQVDGNGNTYKTDQGIEEYEMKFSLSKYIEGGYHYTVTVNIEKAATVKLRSLHTNAEDELVLNTFTYSQSVLYGKRGSSDADAPYNQAAYQTDRPFSVMSGKFPGAMNNQVSTEKSKPEQERYVLRC